LPGGKQTPVLVVTAIHDDDMVNQAFEAGASDYLTKPIRMSVLRHRIKHLIQTRRTEENLRRALEDLDFLHRIDRELGYTLNLERVLNLTMDTAIRRTAATACVIGWNREGTHYLRRISGLGKPKMLEEAVRLDEIGKYYPNVDRIFKEELPILVVETDEKYTEILLPLVARGKPHGIIGLERVPKGFADQADYDFLIYLASRTSAAIEKVNIYQKTQEHAERMDKLHEVSSAISSRLERDAVMTLSARGLVTLLDGSGGFFCEYDMRTNAMTVRSIFDRQGKAGQTPDLDTVYQMHEFGNTETITELFREPMQIDMKNQDIFPAVRHLLKDIDSATVLLMPLNYEDELLGLTVLTESQETRYFQPDEIVLAGSFSRQATVALQNATLFSNVQELEKIKSEMIRMASHDLRNPLTQISGYLNLFMSKLQVDLNEQQTRFVDNIWRGVDRMQNLLEDILNIEKIESDQPTSWTAVDVSNLVREVSYILRPQMDLKNHKFSMDITDGLTVLGSDLQLRQALNNLINNAIKYTPDGGEITVRLYLDQNHLQFEVEDNGYGIPLDRQKQLFQRFYRALAPGTEGIQGTGLGLSLVKTVIERHGGKVWFESEENQGSKFGFRLPPIDNIKAAIEQDED
jgi:signal transduction histidine kinase